MSVAAARRLFIDRVKVQAARWLRIKEGTSMVKQDGKPKPDSVERKEEIDNLVYNLRRACALMKGWLKERSGYHGQVDLMMLDMAALDISTREANGVLLFWRATGKAAVLYSYTDTYIDIEMIDGPYWS